MNQKDREILGQQRIKMDKLQKQIDEIKTVVDKIYSLLKYEMDQVTKAPGIEGCEVTIKKL